MGFSITIKNLAWIDGTKDDPEDLCLHGHAIAVIGSRTLEYENATVSSTALYLLRTLTEDHQRYQDTQIHPCQMLPCCGHMFIADETLDNVDIGCCPDGEDWAVYHNDNGTVSLMPDKDTEEIVSIEDYRAEVFRFADMIEDFYASCSPKKMPVIQSERNGYIAFWNEWHRRRGRSEYKVPF